MNEWIGKAKLAKAEDNGRRLFALSLPENREEKLDCKSAQLKFKFQRASIECSERKIYVSNVAS